MKTRLSIVIPAYNASGHIAKTLESIVSQTDNAPFEVIIIDDGSSDNTEDVVANYRTKYRYIRYIRTSNHGPAIARNTGLLKTRGEYLWYVDSDDTIKPGSIQKVLELIEKRTNLDILMFGFDIVGPAKRPIIYMHRLGHVYVKNNEGLATHLATLYEDNMLNQVWNKVFNVQMLKKNGVLFQNFRYGEDRLFVFDALSHSKKIEILNETFYEYSVSSNESLISKFYDKKFSVSLLIHSRIVDLCSAYNNLNGSALEMLNYMFLKSVLSSMANIFSPSCFYTIKEKYYFIAEILNTPEVKMAAKSKYKRPFYFKLLVIIIRTRLVIPNLILAYLVSFVSKSTPKYFINFKHSNQGVTK